jgi:plasminogen activator inhibitor 1 RNA-binding protein
MSQIASKNIYELLGNDPELDPDRPADPPTRAIEKPVMRHGKRDGPDAPKPMPERLSHQNRAKQTDNANENAFRDRGVGSDKNRGRGSGEPTGASTRGRGRGRGGRAGGRGGAARAEGDRHSRTGIADHDKQAAHGWGGNDGNAELADEQAGEAIAQAEEKDAIKEDAEDAAEAEPEDKSKSYTAYLAELAERKLSLAAQNVRKANEGSSKKFPEGTALAREEQEDFMAGSQGKAKRERARKEKVHVELDGDRMLAPPRP